MVPCSGPEQVAASSPIRTTSFSSIFNRDDSSVKRGHVLTLETQNDANQMSVHHAQPVAEPFSSSGVGAGESGVNSNDSAGSAEGAVPPPPAVIGNDHVAATLCYFLGFIGAFLLLGVAPYNRRPFVRFHAFQSIFMSISWLALAMVGVFVAQLVQTRWFLLTLYLLVGLAGILPWMLCIYKAYNRECYQLPVVGEFAMTEAMRRR